MINSGWGAGVAQSGGEPPHSKGIVMIYRMVAVDRGRVSVQPSGNH